jgi:hypothetical protein
MYLGTIKPTDVGNMMFDVFGNIAFGGGRIDSGDVGKRAYKTSDGFFRIENSEQRDTRLSKVTPEQQLQLDSMTELVAEQTRHNAELKRIIEKYGHKNA